jgi:hypothetical protein
LEDKLVQRATVAVLSAIYEEDFLGCSYGFRPKRGQHDALDALVVGIISKKVNYILDADIRSFFDSVSQSHLVRLLEHRIADPRIIRLIQKWLKAGVLEDGAGARGNPRPYRDRSRARTPGAEDHSSSRRCIIEPMTRLSTGESMRPRGARRAKTNQSSVSVRRELA